jgi:hypothetical protein
VRPLLDQPNVTLLVNAEVERLETDPAGRTVTRVQVNRDGSQEFYEGDIVVYHNSKAIVALDKECNDTVFQKTLGLNDFYLAGNGRQWPLGNIQMLGKSNAMAMKGEEPKLTMLAPKWSLQEVARPRGERCANVARRPAGHQGRPRVLGHGRQGALCGPFRAGLTAMPESATRSITDDPDRSL